MKKQTILRLALLVPLLLGLSLFGADFAAVADAPAQQGGPLLPQAPVGTAFTYQGQLADGGTPVDGTCDFTFALFDDASNGTQIGSDVVKNGETVTNGSFAIQIDFGASAFTGDARFLEVTVNCGSGATTLTPRQELTPVPYALGLRPGATIEGNGTLLTATTSGTGAMAIVGSATGGSNPVGVYGTSSSSSGRGLFGEATSTSGANSGVRGVSASTDSNATGVYGLVTDSGATGTGVKGQNNGTSGYGVWGQGGSGATGVLGQSGSSDDYGVWALNTGTGIGLRAESASGSIIEGWDLDDPIDPKFVVSNDGHVHASGGLTVLGGSDDSVTLDGSGTVLTVTASGSGALAIVGSATGATNPAGVYGTSSSSGGRGVFGEATNTSGANSGVRGVTRSSNSNATGVYGLVIESNGTGSGVKGQNNGTNGYGVWGQGGNGATGVLGQTNSSTKYGVWAYNSGTGVALRAEGSGNFIEAWDLSPVDLRFRVDNSGNVTADGSYTSPAADFAEMLPAVRDLVPGDVLAVGPDGKLVRSTRAYQTTVVGVHSTKPAFLGGATDEAGMSDQVPLAIVGIVPVKASAENGAIQPGDLLVASDTPGHAMRAGDSPPTGTVIGKALGGLETGTGTIQMLVTLQ